MNLLRSCMVLMLTMGLAGMGLTACEQGAAPSIEPGEEAPAAPEDNNMDAPVPMNNGEDEEATEAEEVAMVETEVEEEVLWDSGLLANGSFEEWENGTPVGWSMSSGGGKRSTEAYNGDFALEIPDAGEDNWPIVSKTFDASHFLGEVLNYGATFRADEPEKVVVQVRYKVDGETIRSSLTHPGDGEWHEMYRNTTLPEEIDDNEIEIALFRRPNTEGNVFFDNVRLEVID